VPRRDEKVLLVICGANVDPAIARLARALRPAHTGADMDRTRDRDDEPLPRRARTTVTNDRARARRLQPLREDAALVRGGRREGAAWADEALARFGPFVGRAEYLELGALRQQVPPSSNHDRFGNRVDWSASIRRTTPDDDGDRARPAIVAVVRPQAGDYVPAPRTATCTRRSRPATAARSR
jgi:hypothetical protein